MISAGKGQPRAREMRFLRTQVVPGLPHAQNKTAFDWGLKGLVAYGCHSVVVVIDPRTVQPLQTLAQHKSNVVKVRWSNEKQHHTLASPYFLRLASVDSSSTCLVWDVGQASVISEFSLGSKTLVDMQWLNGPAQDLLAVMLSPSSLTIWNAGTGAKVNRVTFSETIEAFTFSPFRTENLVLLSPDCFIFVSDFNPARTPTTGGGKKFYMTKHNRSPTPMPPHAKSPSQTPWRLLSADNLKGEDSVPQVDCLQITFSPAQEHHLLIVYPREIVIMDTEIHQAIGSVSLERNASPLLQVMPCRHRDVLFCVHENGCISMRVRQNAQLPSTVPTSPLDPVVSGVSYSLCCFSEPLRISKMCTVFAGALCPVSEKRVAVLTSEGRVLVWGVEFEQIGLHGQEFPEDSTPVSVLSAYPVEAGLVDLQEGAGQEDPGEKLTLADTIAPHWFSPPEGCTSSYALLTARFLLSGMWCGISGQTTALRMCPPLTTKNWTYYVPRIAVGTKAGIIFIVNLNTQTVDKEYAIHACPVGGIEWLNQFRFVSWGHSSSNQVRNEIMVTDLLTGRVTPLTRDAPLESAATPIETIRISSHKNYMVAKYRDRPLEFWDAKTFTFMRELVSNPPTFSCVEWFPTHGKHRPPKTDDSLVDYDLAMGTTDSKMATFQEREVLNVMDEAGSVWQISIEGSRVKVIKSIPYNLPLSNPCGMSFKSDLMVSGDQEGNVCFLDNMQSNRTMECPRGLLRKVKFAPGKGNFKLLLLYVNRLDIRDAQGDALLGQLKWAHRDNNNHFSVEDADWATSDKPIVVSSDGCIRVYDSTLKTCNSALNLVDTEEPVFCPHMVLPQASLRLKAMLQHQPWNLEYALDPMEIEDPDNIEKALKCQLELLPEEYRCNLLDAGLGTPQRAIITASLFGDQRELDFWSVALYYILREKNRLEDPRYSVYKQSEPRQPDSDIIRPNSEASTSIVSFMSKKFEDFLGPLGDTNGAETPSPTSLTPSQPSSGKALPVTLSQREIAAMMQDTQLKTHSILPPLDLCYNLFCDADTYQRTQLYRALLHDSKRQTYEQTRKCAETLLLLGQTDRAVQLLLETDSSSVEYYTDALKACLTATIRSSGASQSTIKLVATNLIANARLMDGVQLLCLIDKGLDGCRYLQTYGEWYSAAWLAKATLGEKECSEVFSKWAEHLASVTVSQKEKALLVLLSLGNFLKIIEMLYGMRYFDQAAVFTEACLEYGVIKINEQTSPLIEAVFLEYARYLQSLGLTRGLRHYCSRAGEKGKKLLEQYHSSGLKMPASSDTGNAPT